MWKKLPGGIKLDPMQPKLSTNNRGFQTASKSGHQFLRRFSEHRAATHLLIKKWNLSLNRTVELLPNALQCAKRSAGR
jgi:hypothetical protein